MRSAYISLAAAALCWSGVSANGFASGSDGMDEAVMVGHRLLLAGVGAAARPDNGTLRISQTQSANSQLELRQSGAQCGPQYGRCANDLCCSDYGFCGDSIDHCHPLFDCQTAYGVCGWPRPVAPPPTTSTTSTTSSSTTSTSTTTIPTTSTTSTTSTSTTTPSAPPTSTTSTAGPIPTGPLVVTTNGQCGNSTVCIGSPNFGPCCSQFFWCGSTLDFCGTGCKSEFGACSGSPGGPGGGSNTTTTTTSTSTTVVTTSTTSTSTPPVTTTTSTTSTTSTRTSTSASPTVTIPPGFVTSTNGQCGPGITCLGSTYGRCCSQFGWCGDSDQFCPPIVGCQPEYGYCDRAF
ncbi:hypothetical protein B0T17DRAFT_511690 [Bombardia bombarda]|uniref:Chitin-binding type-1 domain-containing protein n=1 Tax=Bombardia bombarda TaxID=252184 RepID=A0AA39TZB5_9PEZI|nr:hypothetical protein B0T17DRAFT_511690 [Bombardia bombarda]